MTSFSTKSPRLVSPLQHASTSHATFSDALVALGFSPARSQKYEWLSSYPEARPLLSAIQTSFSPQCVLAETHASKYANLAQKQPQLPDDQLFEASRPLTSGAPLFHDVHRQRQARLNAARKRLDLLNAQKDVLREAVVQKRARPRGAMSPRTPPPRRNRPDEEPSVQRLVEQLRAGMLRDSVSFGADASVDIYCQREHAFFDELLTYARQSLQERAPNDRAAPAEPQKLSMKQLVASHATIKADQCMREARLARANAMLTSISLSKGAYLEKSTASMHSLIKDLRDRGAKALKAKAKHVEEQAQDSLWSRIHTISLTETLRQQNTILELARFCAVVCLEQRIRILCFHLATRTQAGRYRMLFDALLRLLSKSSKDTLGEQEETSFKQAECGTGTEENQVLEMQKKIADMEVTEDELNSTSISALENGIFDSAVRTMVDLITGFVHRIGREDSWLRLDSHQDYAPLLAEFEKILNHNTSILEAVLKRRGLPNGVSPQGQNWVRIVNSRQQ